MKISLAALLLALPLCPRASAAPFFAEVDAARALKQFEAAPMPAFKFVPAPTPWQQILAKAPLIGTFKPSDGMLPDGYWLEDIRGARENDHDADYLNIWGHQAFGQFHPAYITMVSEQWRLDSEQHWRISQWLFTCRNDGSVINASARLIIETTDGTVLDLQSFRKTPEEIQAQWALLTAHWQNF